MEYRLNDWSTFEYRAVRRLRRLARAWVIPIVFALVFSFAAETFARRAGNFTWYISPVAPDASDLSGVCVRGRIAQIEGEPAPFIASFLLEKVETTVDDRKLRWSSLLLRRFGPATLGSPPFAEFIDLKLQVYDGLALPLPSDVGRVWHLAGCYSVDSAIINSQEQFFVKLISRERDWPPGLRSTANGQPNQLGDLPK